jgi:voltage-gated potassium channel
VAVRRKFEIPVLVAALAVVPVIFLEERATSPTSLALAGVANWVIWAVFAAEYVSVLAATDRKLAYTRRAWLDVLILVISFPLLPAGVASVRLLRLTRLARVLRLLRLVRLAAILTRGGKAVQGIFRKRGLGYMALLTVLVALGLGGVFALVEGGRLADGLWWAIVTLTTVGYGDVYPVTGAGRAAASVLMLLGIGFMAFITASVAAYFVGEEEADLAGELRGLRERLDRIEQLLEFRAGMESTAGRTVEGLESQ